MAAKVLDGKLIASKITSKVAKEIENLVIQGKSRPGLAVILVGEDPASQVYVRNKKVACDRVGISSKSYALPTSTTEAHLLDIIQQLNLDPVISGILVQLPLPEHINSDRVICAINPAKDVDGFHPYNLGRLAQRNPTLRPCTPLGIMRMLEETREKLSGKNAVVVGASNIVGIPMVLELIGKGVTVSCCHSLTKCLASYTLQAEILVVAAGSPNLITKNMIKPDAIVIDVGINRLESGQLSGDVDFEAALKVASWITPVPGGVGPMTIAALLSNTLQAKYKQAKD